eukprot:m.310057 g.310057  ORF g.310057 m.310057 type:complete len:139 (+) comp49380_c0_seq1:2280-2696(+)
MTSLLQGTWECEVCRLCMGLLVLAIEFESHCQGRELLCKLGVDVLFQCHSNPSLQSPDCDWSHLKPPGTGQSTLSQGALHLGRQLFSISSSLLMATEHCVHVSTLSSPHSAGTWYSCDRVPPIGPVSPSALMKGMRKR